MRLSKSILLLPVCVMLALGARADVPILSESRSVAIAPSVFILEDHNGAAARVSEWVKLAGAQYYVEAVDSLKSELAAKKANGYSSSQTEKSLAAIQADAAHGLIPRWAENVFVVCRENEVIVAFFARNGGWSKAGNGSLVALHSPAYVCTIDPKVGVARNAKDTLKAAVFADLYADMARAGVVSDFAENDNLIAPLNAPKTDSEDAAKR